MTGFSKGGEKETIKNNLNLKNNRNSIPFKLMAENYENDNKSLDKNNFEIKENIDENIKMKLNKGNDNENTSNKNKFEQSQSIMKNYFDDRTINQEDLKTISDIEDESKIDNLKTKDKIDSINLSYEKKMNFENKYPLQKTNINIMKEDNKYEEILNFDINKIKIKPYSNNNLSNISGINSNKSNEEKINEIRRFSNKRNIQGIITDHLNSEASSNLFINSNKKSNVFEMNHPLNYQNKTNNANQEVKDESLNNNINIINNSNLIKNSKDNITNKNISNRISKVVFKDEDNEKLQNLNISYMSFANHNKLNRYSKENDIKPKKEISDSETLRRQNSQGIQNINNSINKSVIIKNIYKKNEFKKESLDDQNQINNYNSENNKNKYLYGDNPKNLSPKNHRNSNKCIINYDINKYTNRPFVIKNDVLNKEKLHLNKIAANKTTEENQTFTLNITNNESNINNIGAIGQQIDYKVEKTIEEEKENEDNKLNATLISKKNRKIIYNSSKSSNNSNNNNPNENYSNKTKSDFLIDKNQPDLNIIVNDNKTNKDDKTIIEYNNKDSNGLIKASDDKNNVRENIIENNDNENKLNKDLYNISNISSKENFVNSEMNKSQNFIDLSKNSDNSNHVNLNISGILILNSKNETNIETIRFQEIYTKKTNLLNLKTNNDTSVEIDSNNIEKNKNALPKENNNNLNENKQKKKFSLFDNNFNNKIIKKDNTDQNTFLNLNVKKDNLISPSKNYTENVDNYNDSMLKIIQKENISIDTLKDTFSHKIDSECISLSIKDSQENQIDDKDKKFDRIELNKGKDNEYTNDQVRKNPIRLKKIKEKKYELNIFDPNNYKIYNYKIEDKSKESSSKGKNIFLNDQENNFDNKLLDLENKRTVESFSNNEISILENHEIEISKLNKEKISIDGEKIDLSRESRKSDFFNKIMNENNNDIDCIKNNSSPDDNKKWKSKGTIKCTNKKSKDIRIKSHGLKSLKKVKHRKILKSDYSKKLHKKDVEISINSKLGNKDISNEENHQRIKISLIDVNKDIKEDREIYLTNSALEEIRNSFYENNKKIIKKKKTQEIKNKNQLIDKYDDLNDVNPFKYKDNLVFHSENQKKSICENSPKKMDLKIYNNKIDVQGIVFCSEIANDENDSKILNRKEISSENIGNTKKEIEEKYIYLLKEDNSNKRISRSSYEKNSKIKGKRYSKKLKSVSQYKTRPKSSKHKKSKELNLSNKNANIVNDSKNKIFNQTGNYKELNLNDKEAIFHIDIRQDNSDDTEEDKDIEDIINDTYINNTTSNLNYFDNNNEMFINNEIISPKIINNNDNTQPNIFFNNIINKINNENKNFDKDLIELKIKENGLEQKLIFNSNNKFNSFNNKSICANRSKIKDKLENSFSDNKLNDLTNTNLLNLSNSIKSEKKKNFEKYNFSSNCLKKIINNKNDTFAKEELNPIIIRDGNLNVKDCKNNKNEDLEYSTNIKNKINIDENKEISYRSKENNLFNIREDLNTQIKDKKRNSFKNNISFLNPNNKVKNTQKKIVNFFNSKNKEKKNSLLTKRSNLDKNTFNNTLSNNNLFETKLSGIEAFQSKNLNSNYPNMSEDDVNLIFEKILTENNKENIGIRRRSDFSELSNQDLIMTINQLSDNRISKKYKKRLRIDKNQLIIKKNENKSEILETDEETILKEDIEDIQESNFFNEKKKYGNEKENEMDNNKDYPKEESKMEKENILNNRSNLKNIKNIPLYVESIKSDVNYDHIDENSDYSDNENESQEEFDTFIRNQVNIKESHFPDYSYNFDNDFSGIGNIENISSIKNHDFNDSKKNNYKKSNTISLKYDKYNMYNNEINNFLNVNLNTLSNPLSENSQSNKYFHTNNSKKQSKNENNTFNLKCKSNRNSNKFSNKLLNNLVKKNSSYELKNEKNNMIEIDSKIISNIYHVENHDQNKIDKEKFIIKKNSINEKELNTYKNENFNIKKENKGDLKKNNYLLEKKECKNHLNYLNNNEKNSFKKQKKKNKKIKNNLYRNNFLSNTDSYKKIDLKHNYNYLNSINDNHNNIHPDIITSNNELFNSFWSNCNEKFDNYLFQISNTNNIINKSNTLHNINLNLNHKKDQNNDFKITSKSLHSKITNSGKFTLIF